MSNPKIPRDENSENLAAKTECWQFEYADSSGLYHFAFTTPTETMAKELWPRFKAKCGEFGCLVRKITTEQADLDA